MGDVPWLGIVIGLLVSGLAIRGIATLVRAPFDYASRASARTLEDALRAQQRFTLDWFMAIDRKTAIGVDFKNRRLAIAERTGDVPRVTVIVHTALRRAEVGLGNLLLEFDGARAFERQLTEATIGERMVTQRLVLSIFDAAQRSRGDAKETAVLLADAAPTPLRTRLITLVNENPLLPDEHLLCGPWGNEVLLTNQRVFIVEEGKADRVVTFADTTSVEVGTEEEMTAPVRLHLVSGESIETAPWPSPAIKAFLIAHAALKAPAASPEPHSAVRRPAPAPSAGGIGRCAQCGIRALPTPDGMCPSCLRAFFLIET